MWPNDVEQQGSQLDELRWLANTGSRSPEVTPVSWNVIIVENHRLGTASSLLKAPDSVSGR